MFKPNNAFSNLVNLSLSLIFTPASSIEPNIRATKYSNQIFATLLTFFRYFMVRIYGFRYDRIMTIFTLILINRHYSPSGLKPICNSGSLSIACIACSTCEPTFTKVADSDNSCRWIARQDFKSCKADFSSVSNSAPQEHLSRTIHYNFQTVPVNSLPFSTEKQTKPGWLSSPDVCLNQPLPLSNVAA